MHAENEASVPDRFQNRATNRITRSLDVGAGVEKDASAGEHTNRVGA